MTPAPATDGSAGSRRRALGQFLGRVDRDAVATAVSTRRGVGTDAVRRLLDTYLNECHVGLALVEPHLVEGARLLEIGAGVGALSAFLTSCGHDVTAIEPAGDGFELLHDVRDALDRCWPEVSRPYLPIGVGDLDDAHGTFDLAYSVNVVEHLPDLPGALASIHRRLAPTGRSVHLCPNYVVPYEPHFGVPLVPIRPELTARLLPSSITATGLWRSLNFVTARDVERVAARLDLTVRFAPRVLATTVDRLSTDAEFRARHARLAAAVDLVVVRLRAGRLLERWPARWATPMVIELRPAPPGQTGCDERTRSSQPSRIAIARGS